MKKMACITNSKPHFATIFQMPAPLGSSPRLAGLGVLIHRRAYTNLYCLSLSDSCTSCFFAAASTLSSHIVTVGNEVLLATSPSCGIWYEAGAGSGIANEPEFVQLVSNLLNQRNTLAFSNQYVQNCLSGSQSSPLCSTFKTSQLNWTFTTDAPCSFEDGMCLGAPNSSLQIDTGYIDSRDGLGINGDDAQRIQYRKTATCIPITTVPYFGSGNGTVNGIVAELNAAFYGPNNAILSSAPENGGVPNATFVTSLYKSTETQFDFEWSPYGSYSLTQVFLRPAFKDYHSMLTSLPLY
jgi:hypothetical protein